MARRHPPLLLHAPAAVLRSAAQLRAWGWGAAEAAAMARRCPLLLTLRLDRPRYALRLRYLQARGRPSRHAAASAAVFGPALAWDMHLHGVPQCILSNGM